MKQFFLAENVGGVSKFILWVIFFNAIIITISEFPRFVLEHNSVITSLEIICVLIFIAEFVSKVYRFSWSSYIAVAWNKTDFVLIILSLPILLMPFIEIGGINAVLTLRLVRFIRLLKILSIVPKGGRFVHGLKRALRASIGVAIGMVMLLFISALFSTMIFRDHAPEMFGNPLQSAYSMFRVFAITGWFEIPRNLLSIPYYDTVGWTIFIRCYFIGFLLSGGMIGLSIFNATFIDALVEDNTEGVEKRLDLVEQRLDKIEDMLDKIYKKL